MSEALDIEQALGLDTVAFRLLYENPRIGVMVLRGSGIIHRANPTLCRLLGFEPGALDGVDVLEITFPEDRPASAALFELDLSASPDIHLDKRYRRRDGTPLWAEVVTRWTPEPQGPGSVGLSIVFDIHRRKETEARLQSLASELTVAEERERRQVAEELHDHVGQVLAVANLRLGGLRRRCDDPEPRRELEEVQRLLETALRFTRTVTFQLSPPLLHQLGLSATLEWLAEQQSDLVGVPVRFHDDGRPKPVADEVQILLYRSVRELLVNVAKHARASQAQVRMRRDETHVIVDVEDDGVGLGTADPLKRAGFGLYSIRERLAALGGHMDIDRPRTTGTRITLRAPLESSEEVEG